MDYIEIVIVEPEIIETVAATAIDKALGNREGWADFHIKTPDQGVATHVYAAFDSALDGTVDSSNPFELKTLIIRLAHNSSDLIDSRIGDPLTDTIKPWASSSLEARRLWHLSEKLVGQDFAY